MVKRPTSGAAPGGDDNGDDNEMGGRGPRIDPLVKALLGHLPPSKSVWPPQERAKWVALLSEALGVIYRDAEPPKPAGQPHGAPAQHQTGTVSPTR